MICYSYYQKAQNRQIQSKEQQLITESQNFNAALKKYKVVNKKYLDLKNQQVDVTLAPNDLKSAKKELFKNYDYKKMETILAKITIYLQTQEDKKNEELRLFAEAEQKARLAAEEEAKKGTITGIIKEGDTNILKATIVLLSGKTIVATTTTAADGSYTIRANFGKYTLQITKSGYATTRQSVEIIAGQSIALAAAITRSVPVAVSSGSSSTTNSSYIKKTIDTSRGTFTIHLLTMNLGNGAIKVKTDTADDNDCLNDCPVKSLQSMVNLNGGFAGMNGTYFCPTDYSSCADKKNTFFWKIYNSRLSKMINNTNGLGEIDPFLIFDENGKPTYLNQWNNRGGYSYTAGINSFPRLVENGQNILNVDSLDTKQRSTKSNRGALGIKGTTLYGVISLSSTVVDLAEIMKSLEVDSALNIDGGGSSAIYYNGAYKVGPGRSLPNAIIFTGG